MNLVARWKIQYSDTSRKKEEGAILEKREATIYICPICGQCDTTCKLC